MISVIICSRSGTISAELKQNIASTIGCAYELLIIKGGNSIFKAYNEGAAVSSNNLLCFLHEDVLFLNQGWGNELASVLKMNKAGLVGLAGSIYKSEIPSPWWLINPPDYEVKYVNHLMQKENLELTEPDCVKEVLVIDGVFIGCQKDLLLKMPFDERQYDGFHFYDLDISLHFYYSGYKNFVTSHIHLFHSSSGKLNLSWIKNAILFHQKWKEKLPLHLYVNPIPHRRQIELKLLKEWVILLSKYRYSFKLLVWNYARYTLKRPAFRELFQLSKIALYNLIHGSKN